VLYPPIETTRSYSGPASPAGGRSDDLGFFNAHERAQHEVELEPANGVEPAFGLQGAAENLGSVFPSTNRDEHGRQAVSPARRQHPLARRRLRRRDVSVKEGLAGGEAVLRGGIMDRTVAEDVDLVVERVQDIVSTVFGPLAPHNPGLVKDVAQIEVQRRAVFLEIFQRGKDLSLHSERHIVHKEDMGAEKPQGVAEDPHPHLPETPERNAQLARDIRFGAALADGRKLDVFNALRKREAMRNGRTREHEHTRVGNRLDRRARKAKRSRDMPEPEGIVGIHRDAKGEVTPGHDSPDGS